MFKVAILTISDSSYYDKKKDLSGPALKSMIEANDKYIVEQMDILPDDEEVIFEKLCQIADAKKAHLILTTGGTGFAKRDVTPEATYRAIDKYVPGISEEMRRFSMKITKHAILSREISGIRKHSLIINLPGSPKAATENLSAVLDVLGHGLKLLMDLETDCGKMRHKR
ncbi:MAG: MogA/MoaB family molybdenum cofactor biosynthesis protein [Tissierellia bacterium]|nr:MogA/MoaB family molybdenum cofactor biosynthesis protein [Tissierellia bacterium]